MGKNCLLRWICWIFIFGIAMGLAEAAVVLYLRMIYYPGGFEFPLKLIADQEIIIEVYREMATIFLLLSFSALAGKSPFERFSCFIMSFGIWDIFYYVWLKVLLDWPATIFDWDILFLIPVPWIGPVMAPVSVSLLLILSGIIIAVQYNKGRNMRFTLLSNILALTGSMVILYSFMYDTGATLNQQMPEPYRYELLFIGEFLLIAGFAVSFRDMVKRNLSV
jgi:hypothetical protein